MLGVACAILGAEEDTILGLGVAESGFLLLEVRDVLQKLRG